MKVNHRSFVSEFKIIKTRGRRKKWKIHQKCDDDRSSSRCLDGSSSRFRFHIIYICISVMAVHFFPLSISFFKLCNSEMKSLTSFFRYFSDILVKWLWNDNGAVWGSLDFQLTCRNFPSSHFLRSSQRHLKGYIFSRNLSSSFFRAITLSVQWNFLTFS